ncbi:MAG: hypothetical protein RMJ66_08340, partial [Bacteroidia bacterium]|nr:hypothetical protein [Bacteroidia bacterium]MDW8135056.1 hypothetical protein [Bacteroidia bacterium]
MNWPELYLHMKVGTGLDEVHRQQIEAALEKYPFFALGRMMVAKIATKLGDSRAPQLRFLASLYAPARQHYAFFMEERLRPRVPPPPRIGSPTKESSAPPPSSKAQEEPSPKEEPEPAEMPFSPAFWPPLQGWIAARQVLYIPLANHIRKQLRWEFITPSPPITSAEETLPTPPRPPEIPQAESVAEEKDLASPHQAAYSSPPTAPEEKPAIEMPSPFTQRTFTSISSAASSPPMPLLQFELPFSSARPTPPTKEEPEISQAPSEIESSTISPLSSYESETAKQEVPPEPPQSIEPSPKPYSQFHRPFIPLEDITGNIHLDTEMPPEKIPPVPLYVSESPIRPLIPLEIDITSSIHLPIPEEAEAHPSGISPPSVEEPPP